MGCTQFFKGLQGAMQKLSFACGYVKYNQDIYLELKHANNETRILMVMQYSLQAI